MTKSEPTTANLIEWIFKGFITVLLTISMFLVNSFNRTLENVERSVSGLNVNIATLIEKDNGQTRRLDRHAERLDRLEIQIKTP